MELNAVVKLVISLLASFAAAGIGSLFTFRAIPEWYAGLKKPPYTPPNRAFGPIWTILYILMGIALFLVWREGFDRKDVKIAIGIFAVQLILNFFWTIIFFGFRSLFGGLIEIVFLWISILITIILFYRISKTAGLLLVPYIIWVTIASYLNYTVYILNL